MTTTEQPQPDTLTPDQSAAVVRAIEGWMARTGLSERGAAERLGVSWVTLGQWLAGNRRLTRAECVGVLERAV